VTASAKSVTELTLGRFAHMTTSHHPVPGDGATTEVVVGFAASPVGTAQRDTGCRTADDGRP
jgi:hypothetical protein